jgi:3-hydroxybutyryl-CoA dehydrogenase
MTIAGFSQVAVIGAGQMGSGIAQVLATAGLKVKLTDVNQAALENAKNQIKKSLDKLLQKEVITAAIHKQTHDHIEYAGALDSLKTADIVIEAAVEKAAIKSEIFQKLDEICPPSTVFATNTSSIPITHLAAKTKRADRFIGMHFMNPVPLMKLVEIIPGMATSDETTARVTELAEKAGKTVVKSKDFPGFIVNRVLMPMINEAFHTLHQGIASAEDIDNGMKLGCNQPMGPLTLADFIGLDTCLSIMQVMHEGLGDSKYAPCPLLKQYVAAGYLGFKVKRGVYRY